MTLTTERPVEVTSLWRNHDFIMFLGWETLSLLGTHVTALALPLTAIHAFDATTPRSVCCDSCS